MGSLVALFPKVLSVVGAAVGIVEQFKGDKKGVEKQTAAVGLIGVLGGLLEGFDIRWLRDGEVLEAVKGLIDAVVRFQNAVEKAKG